MTLNVKLIYRIREIDDWQSRITRDERDLLAESSEDLFRQPPLLFLRR